MRTTKKRTIEAPDGKIVSGCAGFWGFHFLALRELVGSERVRKARARCAEACDITHVGTRDGRDNSRGRASTFYV